MNFIVQSNFPQAIPNNFRKEVAKGGKKQSYIQDKNSFSLGSSIWTGVAFHETQENPRHGKSSELHHLKKTTISKEEKIEQKTTLE